MPAPPSMLSQSCWPRRPLTRSPNRPCPPRARPTDPMEIKRGIAVSPGVAIGPALVLDTEWFRIPQRFVEGDCAAAEVARLREALAASSREARDHRQAVSAKLGPQYGAIFEAHALMIEDSTLAREIEGLICEQHYAAEYAVSRVMRRYAKALESIDRG